MKNLFQNALRDTDSLINIILYLVTYIIIGKIIFTDLEAGLVLMVAATIIIVKGPKDEYDD